MHSIFKNITNPSDYGVFQPFDFEEKYHQPIHEWVANQTSTLNWIAIGYLLFVHFGPKFMRNRKPWNLQGLLILWNWLLAIFSFCGMMRLAPTLLSVAFSSDGFYTSVCQRVFTGTIEVFWGSLFCISKLFELMDTVFIVLRKSPLIFLHWFHHLSVIYATFYLSPFPDPVLSWSVVINYSVHSIMYSYYALKTMRVKIPKSVSKFITSIQMLQFVFGLGATIYAISVKLNGERNCVINPLTIAIHFSAGSAYLVLFANYFYQTYIKTKDVNQQKQK